MDITGDILAIFMSKLELDPVCHQGTINRCNPLACLLVIVNQRAKGQHCLNLSGQAQHSKASKVPAQHTTDLWILSTPMSAYSTLAKRLVKIYGRLMQTEKSFRNMKRCQYGYYCSRP